RWYSHDALLHRGKVAPLDRPLEPTTMPRIVSAAGRLACEDSQAVIARDSFEISPESDESPLARILDASCRGACASLGGASSDVGSRLYYSLEADTLDLLSLPPVLLAE